MSRNPHLTKQGRAAAATIGTALRGIHHSTACLILGAAVGVVARSAPTDIERFACLGQAMTAVMVAGDQLTLDLKKKRPKRRHK